MSTLLLFNVYIAGIAFFLLLFRFIAIRQAYKNYDSISYESISRVFGQKVRFNKTTREIRAYRHRDDITFYALFQGGAFFWPLFIPITLFCVVAYWTITGLFWCISKVYDWVDTVAVASIKVDKLIKDVEV